MICLRRLSSNRAACRRGSNSIESTPFCRARRCAGSQRRTRPNLLPKHRHEAFPRTSGPPRRVDTRNLLARLPWPEAILFGPVAFVGAHNRPPFEEWDLEVSNRRAASGSSSSKGCANEACHLVIRPRGSCKQTIGHVEIVPCSFGALNTDSITQPRGASITRRAGRAEAVRVAGLPSWARSRVQMCGAILIKNCFPGACPNNLRLYRPELSFAGPRIRAYTLRPCVETT